MVERINLPNYDNQDRIAKALENIASGNSTVEVGMARVDTDGITHSTLKERIDNDITILDGKIDEVQTIHNREAIMPLVSFLSDDTPLEDYDILKPISQATGVPFSLACITNENYATPTLIKAANVAKLHELVDTYGYETISHTVNHYNLSSLTYAEQEYELKTSKEHLEAKGFTVNSIAFPYGGYNADTLKILPKYYKNAYRAGTNKLNDSPIDTYLINRIQFDPSNPNNNLAWYKAKVDEAVAGNKWVIFMCHCGTWLDWMLPEQQQMLIDLINYIKSLNVDIKTCGDAYEQFKNVYETVDGTYRIGAKANIKTGSEQLLAYNDDNKAITAGTPLKDFLEGVSHRTFMNVEAQPFPEVPGGTLITYNYGSERYDQSWQEWHPHSSQSVYWRESDSTGTTWGEFSNQASSSVTLYQENVTTGATLPYAYAPKTTTIEQLSGVYIDTADYLFTEASILITTVGQSNDYVVQELKERNGGGAYRVGIENGWSAWTIEGILVPNTSLIFGEIPAQNYVDKTIAVTGCDIDNLAVVNPKTPLTAGLVWNAFIVAPNIVTIRVSNITSAPITDSGRNWVVKVI